MPNSQRKGPVLFAFNEISVPPAGFDRLMPLGPRFLAVLLSKILGFNLKKVSLPEGLSGKSKIPDYALREFHNLPNGYYSRFFSQGYGVGFNLTMLGEMTGVRGKLAKELTDCTSVLDLGCGDGSSTRALADEGIKEIWGLDPSPYMLVHATQKNQAVKFVQGVGEAMDFHNESFDGIAACWVFHEVPSQYCDLILRECFRILKPGGKLVIAEPSKRQYRDSFLQLCKEFGLRGLYYGVLASLVYEPYIHEWHDQQIRPWLETHGFEVVSQYVGLPEERVVAVRPKRFDIPR